MLWLLEGYYPPNQVQAAPTDGLCPPLMTDMEPYDQTQCTSSYPPYMQTTDVVYIITESGEYVISDSGEYLVTNGES